MKRIFLDFDGVLNNRESIIMNVHLDPYRVMMIDELCRRTDARIVISSTWRRLHSVAELETMLNCVGMSHGRIVGATPTGVPKGVCRGDEIETWLVRNRMDAPIRYVIFDDDSDMLSEQMPYFIQTSFEEGLLPTHVDRAVEILGEKDD